MQKSTNQKSFSYLGKMGDPSYKIEGASATIYPGVFVLGAAGPKRTGSPPTMDPRGP